MSNDKELEIHLQFLDEAQEYLDTLESRLMGVARGIEAEAINEALRAAHSIKGGAALMGFQLLSDLAHRLEDGLKVLKVQRGKLTTDDHLEHLLLQAVDCLAQVMVGIRRNFMAGTPYQPPVDDHWLQHQAQPIFEQLHERLGDPEDEDAHSILSPEDGQDIIPLLFQSEVEGCLQRIEMVLSEHSPRLREEVDILAQELGGLGEMLQLEAFTQLCQSISEQVQVAPDQQLPALTRAALDIWRSTQAQVLAGQLNNLPNQFIPSLAMADMDIQEPGLAIDIEPNDTIALLADDTVPLADLTDDTVPLTDDNLSLSDDSLPLTDDSLSPLSDWLFQTSEPADETSQPTPAAASDHTSDATDPGQLPPSDPDWSMAPAAATGAAAQFVDHSQPNRSQTGSSQDVPSGDSTVRVPVKHINQLSDLFGELTIEHNRLELEVKRLRTLVSTLQTRMRALDQVNSDLRSAYDRVATQSHDQPLLQLPADQPLQPSHNGESQTHHFDVLELDQYLDLHLPFREIIETIVQFQEVGADIDLSLDGTEQTTRNLRKTARQLQRNLSQLRMRPLSDIFERFPRALRQMSLQYNKPVDLEISGEHTLVDRNVLESLQEPLMHIIRNCFDHGIEPTEMRQAQGKPATGTIAIAARQQNNRTWITIRDDGGGISLEKIRDRACRMGLDATLLNAASKQELLSLIFEPGFSTASEVTSLSGRGIGMDVVRNKLKAIRGDIQVDTDAGKGTVFTMSIPFTLSVTRVLIAESRGMRMAFPVEAIEEIFALDPQDTFSAQGKTSFKRDGQTVQLIHLADWLHFNCPISLESPEIAPTITTPTVLMVQYNQRRVGIQVDRSWGEQEVALRRVVGNLPMPVGFNSCTILGDGRVVPLVSIPDLLYWIASCEASGATEATDTMIPTYIPQHLATDAALIPLHKPTVLLVDDSINVRRLMALTLEKAGYQVAQAKDGQDALDKLATGLPIAAVICDVEMPRLDGYGFLARLKTMTDYATLPVAMLTSRSSPKHRQMAIKLGAAAYFTKPYNEQNLLQTLESLIQPALVN